MRTMGWSWPDYLACPLDVRDKIVAMIAEARN